MSRLPKGFTIFPPCELSANAIPASWPMRHATIAKELRAVGINMNMAPVLDVNSNPDNPVAGTGLRLLAETVIEMGLVTAAGLQDPRSWPVENISRRP